VPPSEGQSCTLLHCCPSGKSLTQHWVAGSMQVLPQWTRPVAGGAMGEAARAVFGIEWQGQPDGVPASKGLPGCCISWCCGQHQQGPTHPMSTCR
jgi:hypothetical protein